MLGYTGHGFLKNPCGDLHRADLTPAGAALLGQADQPPMGLVAHRHLGMAHPARIGRPARADALARLKAGLNVGNDPG
jgi:hypothetical protein